jgi:peptidyl-prolyl cis-trans isomerase SurA
MTALLLLAAISSSPLFAWERVDGIIAVVGDKVILSSELDFQLQMYAVQSGVKIDKPEEARKLKEQLVTQMVNDRLILIKAMRDTMITASESEIEETLTRRIDDLRGRFPGEDEFEKQLEAEGYTFRELKLKLREETREQLLKEKLINKLLNKVSVSMVEVEAFFSTYRDSLPDHPQSVKLAHLLLQLTPSKTTADSLLNLGRMLIERISKGEAFEELAKKYSQDPSAEAGGDIGTVRMGDLMPEFERAALALKPGEVSDIVKTDLGYHIIKLVGRTENQYQAQHILLLSKPLTADSATIEKQANDIIERIRKGEDFGILVKEFSADSTTRANFGELGWMAVNDLPAGCKEAIASLSKDDLSKPVWEPDGLHIFRILDRRESRPFSLTEDWDVLKEYTRRQKSQVVMTSIVNEMKDKVYLNLRDF